MPVRSDAPTLETTPNGGGRTYNPDPLWSVLAAGKSEPFVIAQLGQSLDGRVATPSGESRNINRTAALDHLHRLRAHVDAVVVGIGTVLADDPLLTVRRMAGKSPARVIIDPNGKLPSDALCLAHDGVRRLVVRACAGETPASAEEVVIAGEGGLLNPHAIVKELFARGLSRLLIEGGARTVSGFIAAGAADRLHVLVSPLIIGSGRPSIELDPIASLRQALRPRTDVHVLADGDVLFDCDLRQSEER